jgi:hypothetical protein
MVEDRNSSKLNLSINKLLEVEEHIWSPMYGLKGNIDATVQVACREQGIDKNLVVPLELKTGRRDTNQAHRAQTALYTLLLSDRYGKLPNPYSNLPSTDFRMLLQISTLPLDFFITSKYRGHSASVEFDMNFCRCSRCEIAWRAISVKETFFHRC